MLQHIQHLIGDDSLGLVAVPVMLCAVAQLAGGADATRALGLPVGLATTSLCDVAGAIADRCVAVMAELGRIGSMAAPAAAAASHAAASPRPFPELFTAWRPLLLHTLVHRDASHFFANLVSFVQATGSMRLPWFAADRSWRRALFVSGLCWTGSIAGAVLMDKSARFDTRVATEAAASRGTDILGWLVGSARSVQLSATFMIGASGGIMALVGYNATFAPRLETLLPAAMLVGTDLLAEATRPRAGDGGQWLQQSATAHAAHLGGFLWGAAFGAGLRWIELQRWLRAQATGRRLGHGP